MCLKHTAPHLGVWHTQGKVRCWSMLFAVVFIFTQLFFFFLLKLCTKSFQQHKPEILAWSNVHARDNVKNLIINRTLDMRRKKKITSGMPVLKKFSLPFSLIHYNFICYMCKTTQYVFLCNDKNKFYSIIITVLAFIALLIQKYFEHVLTLSIYTIM